MASSDAALPMNIIPPAHAAGGVNYLNVTRGIRSWMFTLDHKRIGVMYLVSILTAFLLGGIFALLVRTELLTPGGTIMSADTYNKVFTLHGIIMIFLFIIPGVPGALGNFVLPLMLGAKDVAFPRLNLLSYYFYMTGAIFAILAIVIGGVDTGWTFYTPYSTTSPAGGVVAVVVAAFILGFSSILTGVNFIVTIHKLRPPGMTWFRMPLFVWGLYATAVMQVLATPVLGITLLLLIVERTLGVGIFDPALGGDPILFQHFFWFYSHPAVYIMILPAMGIMSELIPVFSRKHIFGYKFIAMSSVAIAVLSFLVWGHHMFVSGQSAMAGLIFSALTYAVAIPSAIKVFNWLATMYKGSIKLDTPMCYALSFFFVFGIGGLTGLFIGALAFNVHSHDTYFIVAHFHYTMMGAVVFVFLGGLHYWWPKITGRMYSEFWGRLSVFLLFVGFNVTFFTQFLLGLHGVPRRTYHYMPQFTHWHRESTAGSYLIGIAFLIMAAYLVHSLFRGRRAPDNPWGSGSLEWQCSSPPPPHNFDKPPVYGDPYDYSDLVYDKAIRGYVRKHPPGSAPPDAAATGSL
jgi:cytochrome c oxidase subunit 1